MRRAGLALAALVTTVATACAASDVEVADPTTTAAVSSTAASPSTAPPSTTSPSIPPTTAPSVTTTTAIPEFFHEGSPMIAFSVEVGDGIDLDRGELVRFVVETLGDERSWIGRGVGFELVDDGGLFTMIVAAPDDVDEMCAPLETVGRYSCARNGWIAFNSLRWFGATEEWPGDLETYRRYLVNHEVGHYVLGPNHERCPGPGELAPVMMQQTVGLDGCLPNGWVDP